MTIGHELAGIALYSVGLQRGKVFRIRRIRVGHWSGAYQRERDTGDGFCCAVHDRTTRSRARLGATSLGGIR